MYERSTPAPRPPQRPELRRYLGRFPDQLTSVKDARDWLSRRLELSRVPDSPTQDALLLLSEITTNALLHSPTRDRSGAFLVSVFVSGNCLRVSVRGNRDASAPALQAVPDAPEAEHGRGLFLVNALATTWGVERTRRGPAVFFTLEWDQQQPPQPPQQIHREPLPSDQQPSPVPAPRTPLRHLGGW